MVTSTTTTPTSCPDENQLALLAEGALADAARAAIDHHLDGCAICTQLVAELARLAAPVRPVPERYQVIRQLGAGAMGVVWECEDQHLGRRVALKFVRPDVIGDRATVRERRARLFREARALAQLRHPNVVTVYDVGESGDELFLALELVIGTDARAWSEARPRTTDEILAVWRSAAAGLAAVHRAGLVHRDIKPDNILVAEDGRVLVGDFGLATADLAATAAAFTAAGALTVTGAVLGTPIYMAHEQLLGEPATHHSDQYALCVSIWEALVGERPFRGTTLGAIAMAMTRPPVPPAGQRIEPHLLAALARGLDPNPAKRFADIDALLAALAPPVRRPRALWIAIGAAALAAAATIAVLAATDRGSSSKAVAADVVGEPPTPTERVVAPPAPAPLPEPRSPHEPASTVAPQAAPARRANHTVAPPPPPETSNPPATQSDWKGILDRATDKLGFDDPAGCLALLRALPPPVPAVMQEQAETLRATCLMASGDCEAGRELFEATATANHWPAASLAVRLESADFSHCPLDAGPRTRWVARATYRLKVAAATQISCKPVLAFIAKHGLQLPDPREAALLETTCHVASNACAAARVSWKRAVLEGTVVPAQRAALEQTAAASFANAFPACR